MNLIAFGRWHIRSLSIIVALLSAMPPTVHGDEFLPAEGRAVACRRRRGVRACFLDKRSSEFHAWARRSCRAAVTCREFRSASMPAKNRHLVYLTHDSETVAYLLIVEFVPDFSRPGRVVAYQEFPSDGRSPPLRHAGGMQLVGDVLAVGLEDNQENDALRSSVLGCLERREARTIETPDHRARRGGQGQNVGRRGTPAPRSRPSCWRWPTGIAVRSTFTWHRAPSLSDPACRFKRLARWQVDSAETTDWRPDCDVRNVSGRQPGRRRTGQAVPAWAQYHVGRPGHRRFVLRAARPAARQNTAKAGPEEIEATPGKPLSLCRRNLGRSRSAGHPFQPTQSVARDMDRHRPIGAWVPSEIRRMHQKARASCKPLPGMAS